MSPLRWQPVLLAWALLVLWSAPAAAQDPLGELRLTTTYQSVVVDGTGPVNLTLDLSNPAPEGQVAEVLVARAPEGWTTTLKSGGFVVRRVYVKGDNNIMLSFQATPPADVQPGPHLFVVEAREGARVLSRLSIEIVVEPGAPGSLSMNVDFPVLGGSPGETFEYKVDLRNDTNQELDLALSADAPEGWQVSFQPSFERTRISSIRLEGGSRKSLDVRVTAPEGAGPAEYPVNIQAAAGPNQATAQLTVIITGTYDLQVTTPTGRLNSAATAGQDRTIPIVLVNSGSAEIPNLTLSARAPSGWEAEMEPRNLNVLPPLSAQEVQLKLKPSSKAIAGDYVVTVSARSPLVSSSQQLRVTVETPRTLGLVGLAVIVVVLGVLLTLFSKYGRR